MDFDNKKYTLLLINFPMLDSKFVSNRNTAGVRVGVCGSNKVRKAAEETAAANW